MKRCIPVSPGRVTSAVNLVVTYVLER